MRETCVSCGRPQRVCLCAVFPKRPLISRTRIVILQHPHETRHKLATVSVVARCLANCEVFVGRRFRPGTCSLLDECAIVAQSSSESSSDASADAPRAGNDGRCVNCGEKRIALLLFPTSTATDLRTWCQSSLRITCSSSSDSTQVKHSSSAGAVGDGGMSIEVLSAPSSFGKTEEEAMADTSYEKCFGGHVILLIVDGTWQHAKEMVKASMPFLHNFVIEVSLPHDASREGWGMGDSDSVLRKEPFAGCVSTMEAIARALAILERDGPQIESCLLSVLEHMVKLQASHFTPGKPRPRLTKKCGGITKT